MINPIDEECFLYADSPKHIGKSESSVRNWVNRGLAATNGETVFLDRVKLTGGYGTSKEAYRRFLAALNGIIPNGDS